MSDSVLPTTVDQYVAEVVRRIPRASTARERIAADVRMHLVERIDAGESEPEAVRRMGTPEEVARAYLAEVRLESAPLSRRLGAFVIDLSLGALLVSPWLWGFGLLTGFGDAPLRWTLPIGILVLFGLSAMVLSVVYFPIAEARFGQTIGKRLLGLCVTTEAGEQIGWGAAIIRRLPFFLEFFWLDALFALFTRRRQRAFDMVARTLVVRCS